MKYIVLSVSEDLFTIPETLSESTIGYEGTRILDRERRTCEECEVENEWWKDVITYFPLLIDNYTNYNEFRFTEAKLLKYSVGSFFTKHIDRVDSISGYQFIGTLVMINFKPDSSGGILIGGGVSISSSDIGDGSCTLVFIPKGLSHEVSLLEKGERNVLKVRIHVPREIRETKFVRRMIKSNDIPDDFSECTD